MFYNIMAIPTVGVYLISYKFARAFQDVSDLIRQLQRWRAAR